MKELLYIINEMVMVDISQVFVFFQANFVNNLIDRIGQIYKNNILFYSREIVNDKPHGLGTKYNPDNTIKYHGIFIIVIPV